MNDIVFEKLVHKAVKEIPREFLEKLENVTILVEDFPTHYQIERLKEKNLKEIIKDTVIHEIAHHFGFSEEQIKKAKR